MPNANREGPSISAGRMRAAIRQWSIIGMLAAGRSCKLKDFAGVMATYHVHRKTLLRDLEALTAVPCFEIIVYKRDGTTFWRMDGKPWGTPVPAVRKFCAKCNKMRDPEEFYASRTAPDGKRTVCKYCTLAYNKQWEIDNKKRRNIWHRNYHRKHKNRINAALREKRAAKSGTVSFQQLDKDIRGQLKKESA